MGLNRFQICCVFDDYDLFKPTTFIQKCIIIEFFYPSNEHEFSYNFDAVLYQFLETGTSDRCFICIVQRLRFLMFHLIPPFIFSLQSLYKETKLYIFSLQKIKWQKLCKRLTNTEYQFFIVKVFYVFFGKRKFLCCKTECHASLTK